MGYLALILTVVAGYILSRFIPVEKKGVMRALVTFSGAFLFGITLVELLPVAFSTNAELASYGILAGFFIQILIDFMSGGIEHGHYHHFKKGKAPMMMMVGLGLHALLEGIPVGFGGGHLDEEVANHLLMAILAHKLPVAIILAGLLRGAGISTWLQLVLVGAFAFMSPLGMLIGASGVWGSGAAVFLSGLAIGIFLHISTTILYESSESHSLNYQKLAYVILGFLLALSTHMLH
jgi:hypothetical protein